MPKLLFAGVFGAALCAAAAASAQAPSSPAPAVHAPAMPPGYLDPAALPDMTRVLPAPPARGGPEDQADKAVFQATRALQGSPRWALAARDAVLDLPALYRDFSCALGVTLAPGQVPALDRILARATASGIMMIDAPKQAFGRPRPFLGGQAPICEARTAELEHEPDYPSGHTTAGWGLALILAELAPDRSTEVLARGRAFGESRVVCGSHTVSAVEAGYVDGAAWVAALHGSPAFRADMDEARAQLAALRAKAPAPAAGTCREEQAQVGARGY